MRYIMLTLVVLVCAGCNNTPQERYPTGSDEWCYDHMDTYTCQTKIKTKNG